MEGNRGGSSGLKRLPLNVIQPSKRCCINKEKRRRSRKGGKSGGRSRVSTYKPVVCGCMRVCYVSVYTYLYGKETRAQPQLVTSKASWKSCKCMKEWVKNPATVLFVWKEEGLPAGKLWRTLKDLKTKTFRFQSISTTPVKSLSNFVLISRTPFECVFLLTRQSPFDE